MNDYKQLFDDSRSYLRTRYDLLRLELLQKLSLILGILVLIIVLLFLGMGALAYLSVALVEWLAAFMPTGCACCLLAGGLILIALTLWFLRTKLFINPFVRLLSSILFSDSDESDDKEKDNISTERHSKE